ncbi:MAG: T9SS type A sorting domain-containing protein [Ignavibacteria bacterium]|jgi:hypothetical protein|nr:T9SS type A sorting domain-containing protein [Ignavibacteria bacterium]
MFRKLFLLIFLFSISAASFANSIYTKDQIKELSRIESKIVRNGDTYKGVYVNGNPRIIPGNPNGGQQPYTDNGTTVTYLELGPSRNFYDLQSNATPVQIWQDPINQNNIHALYMFSSDPGTAWADRTMQYFFSSDRGVTWEFISNVPAEGRSGYGMITGTATGQAFVGLHTAVGANTNLRAQFYIDAFPGLGSFTNLDPGGDVSKYQWPRVIMTQPASLINRYVFVASSSEEDSAFVNVGTSTLSSSFSGYRLINSSQAETYSLARGTDGRIGLAYIVDEARFPTEYGGVFFMESTDNGSTFSAPTKIFAANFNTDSLGALRGISLLYQGTVPKVAFETVKQTTAGNYFGGAPNNIRFWSTSLPGSDPTRSIIIVDSNNVPYAPMLGSNDVEAPVCRPSLGQSSDGTNLFMAFMVQNEMLGGIDSSSYNDIYLTASGNGGASWKRPAMITPTSPRMDWSYVSLSPTNDIAGNVNYINMMVQRDSVPGSNVNSANPGTNAHPVFMRAAYDAPIGINPVSSVADKFQLQQNYPNPFNPTTNIRFTLPKLANVTLKVYGVDGREVATLINNELIGAGTKEISFNGITLASGLYFYTLSAGDFKETKKMMLVK